MDYPRAAHQRRDMLTPREVTWPRGIEAFDENGTQEPSASPAEPSVDETGSERAQQQRIDDALALRLRSVGNGLLALCAAISGVVLILGWGLSIEAVTHFGYQFSAMVPSTAALFFLGSGVVLLSEWHPLGHEPIDGRIAAGFIIVTVALADLVIIVGDFSNGIDHVLWPQTDAFGKLRMSEATAFTFTFLGAALACSRAPHIKSILATVAILPALLALTLFLFEARSISTAAFFSAMSLPTAVCFACLISAILLRHGESGWVCVLFGKGSGSVALRRVLPLALILPFALAFGTSVAIRHRLFDTGFQLSLLALTSAMAVAFLLIKGAHHSNILERERAETEVREAERATALLKSKSRFFANMSHEIRTPMNGILGFSDLLLRDELPPQQRRRIRLIYESSQNMLKLLDSILDLSRIEAGHFSIKAERTDIHHLTQSCANLFKASAAAKGLELRLHLDESVPRYVVGDDLRVRQVLSNLIGNAVKFTSSGSIDIRVGYDDGILALGVRDTGVGIPADKLPSVLAEVVQVEESAYTSRGGSGLGLHICRELVELMGGRITLDSELGIGTSVSVRLPLPPADFGDKSGSDDRSDQSEQADCRWAGRRVALAEDHDINQMLIMEMAERIGLEVELFADGVEAVQGILAAERAGTPFDLALMDVQMPKLDGISATQARCAAKGWMRKPCRSSP